jgi:hypothetical protein
MATLDYMKVLDVAVQTLNISQQVEIQALDLSVFQAVITQPDGKKINVIINVKKFELEIVLQKDIFNEKEFIKWLMKFEYNLEQKFFKNISLSHSETKTDYRIKIPC